MQSIQILGAFGLPVTLLLDREVREIGRKAGKAERDRSEVIEYVRAYWPPPRASVMSLSDIGILSALAAGMISFLSPCVLPLVSDYMSFIVGRSVYKLQVLETRRERLVVIGVSLSFVLGFSTIFIALGTGATAMSRLLIAYRQETNLIGGVIVIVFGLFIAGLITPRWLNRDVRFVHQLQSRGGPLAAYVLGMAFAFGWTPCILVRSWAAS